MQYSLNKDLQHLKWQPTKSWISSPDCLVAMDKQQTKHRIIPKWKWKMLTNYWKFQNRSVQTFGFVYHDTNGQNHGSVWKTQSFQRNLCGHPLAGLSWEEQFEKNLLKHGWEKITNWECLFVHREKGLFLSVYVDDIKLAGKKHNIDPMWKVFNKEVDLGEPTSFLDHVYLGCTQKTTWKNQDIVGNYRTMFESRILAGGTEKLPFLKIFVSLHGLMIWRVMQRNVWSDIVSWPTRRLSNSTKYLLPASMTTTSKKKWNLLENCHKYAPKLFRNACIWQELDDLTFYGLETNAWIDWFHIFIILVNANNIVMWVILQNKADWDCFRTLTSLMILKIRNPLLEEHCVFGSRTFVPTSWMCKKQTSVSHSSTESEIISLDTGLRLDGLLALELWDLIVLVIGNVSRVSDRSGQLDNDVHKRHKSQKKIEVTQDIDSVPSNVQSARQETLLYVFEDNEAVIKMIIKGRSPTMRHVSRTHRVALDWLFDRINLDPKIQIKYIDTKNQLAGIVTKGNFTRDEWNHLLCLFNISHFSSTVCSAAMAMRSQQDSGGERVTAKSRPMMNLIARKPSHVSSSNSVNTTQNMPWEYSENIFEKWLREASEMNYRITARKIGTTRTTTSGTESTTMWTPMTTLTHRTSTIAWRIITCTSPWSSHSHSWLKNESCTFHSISMPYKWVVVSLWLELLHSLLLSLPPVCLPLFYQFVVYAGDHRCWQKSREENAEESLLGMVRYGSWFITINQFSVDFVTSVHVCPKNSATHATLSLKVWGMREVVSNEMNVHGFHYAFTGTITFMSMFNDISWDLRTTRKNASQMLSSSLDAKKCGAGQWSFLCPG